MRRYSTYSLVLFAVAGAAFVAGGWHSQKEAVSAAAPHAETSRRVLYYSDGMHPQIKAEKPGSCPICGMTLEPVYAEAQAGAAPHHLSSPALTALPSAPRRSNSSACASAPPRPHQARIAFTSLAASSLTRRGSIP
jgi:hypothetical protein